MSRRRLLRAACAALVFVVSQSFGVITLKTPPPGATVATILRAAVDYQSNVAVVVLGYGNLDAKGDFVRDTSIANTTVTIDLTTGMVEPNTLPSVQLNGLETQYVYGTACALKNGIEAGLLDKSILIGTHSPC